MLTADNSRVHFVVFENLNLSQLIYDELLNALQFMQKTSQHLVYIIFTKPVAMATMKTYQ